MNVQKIKSALEELALAIKDQVINLMSSEKGVNSKTGTNTLVGSDLMKSVDAKATGYEEITFQIADYYTYVITGRKRGTLPPFNAINDWVIRKGIRFDNMNQVQTTWAVMKAIERDGIRPRPFINIGDDPAVLLPFLDDFVAEFCDRLFDILTEEIDAFFN